MSKTKIAKIITILILIFILLGSLQVYAQVEDPFENPGSWKPGELEEDDEFVEKAGKVLGIIQTIGIIMAVIVIVAAGIKFMFSSVEEKADYQKAMMPYLIGAVFLIATSTIPNIIFKLTSNVLNNI